LAKVCHSNYFTFYFYFSVNILHEVETKAKLETTFEHVTSSNCEWYTEIKFQACDTMSVYDTKSNSNTRRSCQSLDSICCVCS
jgi:hypothetical protein